MEKEQGFDDALEEVYPVVQPPDMCEFMEKYGPELIRGKGRERRDWDKYYWGEASNHYWGIYKPAL